MAVIFLSCLFEFTFKSSGFHHLNIIQVSPPLFFPSLLCSKSFSSLSIDCNGHPTHYNASAYASLLICFPTVAREIFQEMQMRSELPFGLKIKAKTLYQMDNLCQVSLSTSTPYLAPRSLWLPLLQKHYFFFQFLELTTLLPSFCKSHPSLYSWPD